MVARGWCTDEFHLAWVLHRRTRSLDGVGGTATVQPMDDAMTKLLAAARLARRSRSDERLSAIRPVELA